MAAVSAQLPIRSSQSAPAATRHMANFNSARVILVISILSLNCLSWIIQNPGMMATINLWSTSGHYVTHNVATSAGKYCPPQEKNYTVSFLSPSQYQYGWGDIYSGMWWQSIYSMLQTNYSRVGYLEQVTLLSFKNAKEVVQTVDWLDFSVEHLSKYVKHFQQTTGAGIAVRGRLGQILSRYVDRAKQSCHRNHTSSSSLTNVQSAISFTIAVLPIHVSSDILATQESHLLMLQLTATIASLWNVGVPRVVVAGIADNEKVIARQAFALLQEHLDIRLMELEYIPMGGEEDKLVPKVAMIQFQNAIREFRRLDGNGGGKAERIHNSPRESNYNITPSWLGDDPSRWQYIYFSEPDLILHIRPGAASALSNELKRGNLLNAHRLQPLPHMHQFMDVYESAAAANLSAALDLQSQILPELGSFASIHHLDASIGDTCCDQGLLYPGHVDDPSKPLAVRRAGKCNTEWAFCGFSRKDGVYSDWNYVLEKHELLVKYPFISLEGGTGMPLVHHGQRVCTPRRGPAASCE